jgi:hypothetical protein
LCLEEIAFAEARGDSACDATSTTVAIANKLRRDSKFIPLLLVAAPGSKSHRRLCNHLITERNLLAFSSSRFRAIVSIHIMESPNAPASTLGEVGAVYATPFGSPKTLAAADPTVVRQLFELFDEKSTHKP